MGQVTACTCTPESTSNFALSSNCLAIASYNRAGLVRCAMEERRKVVQQTDGAGPLTLLLRTVGHHRSPRRL